MMAGTVCNLPHVISKILSAYISRPKESIMHLRVLALAALLPLTTVAQAADWSRFRGPNGNAVSEEKGLPTKWSDSAENGLVWKTSLPGEGASSPVIAGDKVFVTCYEGREAKVERSVVCVSRKDGKILWKKPVKGVSSEDSWSGMGVPTHGYASNTPATDGERVFAFFGKAGIYAYDLDGKELWHKSVGTQSDNMRWGSGTSPIVYKNLVIVDAAAESKTIYAFDTKTGKEVWKSPADSLGSSWSTPILAETAAGKQELVVAVPGEVWGFNPDDGTFLWYCEGPRTIAACASAVAKDGIVYVVGAQGGGGGGEAVAIKTGGKDDASKNIVWRASSGSYVTSPVIVGDYLYCVSDQGIAWCLNRADGTSVYKERLSGGAAPAGGPPGGGFGGGGRGRWMGGGSMFYASVVAVDGKLYAVSRNKGTFVLAAEPKYKVLATNLLDDTSPFNASPAIQDGQIYLRSDKFLYCIGKK